VVPFQGKKESELQMQHHVQPRERFPLRQRHVSDEIQKFLRAVNSYPDCFAKRPGLSFRQHLASVIESHAARRPRT
jgi:hypothetical protein